MKESSQVKKELELKITFDKSDNTLYELGFISLDVLQLVIFGELIESNQIYDLEEMFEKKKPYGYFTRNSLLYREFRNRTIIKEIRKGCIELIIGGVSATAAVINLIVAIRVQQNLKNDETMDFEISSNDEKLNKLLNDYNAGYYGKGEKGFEWLNKRLSSMGYSVNLQAKNAYIIKKITDDYEDRIIKTLKKN